MEKKNPFLEGCLLHLHGLGGMNSTGTVLRFGMNLVRSNFTVNRGNSHMFLTGPGFVLGAIVFFFLNLN
jgi:hypothetical protein